MKRLLAAFIIALAAEIIAAIICGPYSCEWGNSFYFYSGIACIMLVCIFPFFQKTFSFKKRIAYSLLFLLLTVMVWCAGFMLFGFRIICRLM